MREPTFCAQCATVHTPGSCPSESPVTAPTGDAHAAQRAEDAQVLQSALVTYLAHLPAYPGRIEETLANARQDGVSLDVPRALRQGMVEVFTWSPMWDDPRENADALLAVAPEHGMSADALLRDPEVLTGIQRGLAQGLARNGVSMFRALLGWTERHGITIDTALVLRDALVDTLQRGEDGQARTILTFADSTGVPLDRANPTITTALTEGIAARLADGHADYAKRMLTFAGRQRIPVDTNDARISIGCNDGLVKSVQMLASGPGFAANADGLIAFGKRTLHHTPDSGALRDALQGALADALGKAWMFDTGDPGGILTALHPVHGVLGFATKHRIALNVGRSVALAMVRAEVQGSTISEESVRAHAEKLGVDFAAIQSELPHAFTKALAEYRANGQNDAVKAILRMAATRGIALA